MGLYFFQEYQSESEYHDWRVTNIEKKYELA